MSAELRDAGHAYIDRYGWRVFLERTRADGTRVAIGNCDACRTAGYEHDREMCECLTCHGFYAATSDHGRWDALCDVLGDATHLCVRTGHASGIFVVDLDAKDNGPQTWHEWPQTHDWTFPGTLRQRTKSGGFHLIYALPAEIVIGSHNRVATGMDVKGEGGLVVVAPSPGYTWWPGSPELLRPDPSSPLVRWAVEARGTSRGLRRASHHWARRGSDALAGYDLDTPCPEGARDELVNALTFALRKAGYDRDDALEALRPVWERMEGRGTSSEFRWEWVEYKVLRIWATVEPDADAATVQAGRRWFGAVTRGVSPPAGETRKIGSVTVVGRGKHS